MRRYLFSAAALTLTFGCSLSEFDRFYLLPDAAIDAADRPDGPCGGLNQTCCPENDICHDARTTCSQNLCVACGAAGQVCCGAAPMCSTAFTCSAGVCNSANVLAIGNHGDLARWDGSAWTVMSVGTSISTPVDAIWGTSLTNIYVTGDITIHFNGSGWPPLSPQPGDSSSSFASIWGSGESDIFLAGYGGQIAHFDGNSWTLQSSGITQNIAAVFGFGRSDVWAAGGTILHYDGSGWAPAATNSPCAGGISALWGSSSSDIWVAGDSSVCRWNGSSWSATMPPGALYLMSLWGFGPDDVWVVGTGPGQSGGAIYHCRSAPALACTASVTDSAIPVSVWGLSPVDVWAVGYGGFAVHWNGSTWEPHHIPSSQEFMGLWAPKE